MTQMPIFHALGLHMHQPPNNMDILMHHNEWEARQIIHCYDRAVRYAHKYADTARLHIAFSGILLQQLQQPEIVARYHDILDIPAMLARYRDAENIEFLSTGYFHPIFPLIPPADWEEQLISARQLMEQLFGRAPKGFYPAAMMFRMEMIPALVKAGYEYVIVDHWQVHPQDEEFDPYQPYIASFGGASISIIPRDSDLSNAQQYGLEAAWFADEGRQRAQHSINADKPRLLTTFSDGENSEWFRNMDELYGYFGHFFAPYMEHVNSGEYPIKPIFLSEFLRTYPATSTAVIETPSWQPSGGQQHALQRIHALSERCHSATVSADILSQAKRLLLESETSCFLFWNDAWLDKIHACIDAAQKLLDDALKPKTSATKKTSKKTPESSKTAPSNSVTEPTKKTPVAEVKKEVVAPKTTVEPTKKVPVAEVKKEVVAPKTTVEPTKEAPVAEVKKEVVAPKTTVEPTKEVPVAEVKKEVVAPKTTVEPTKEVLAAEVTKKPVAPKTRVESKTDTKPKKPSARSSVKKKT
jgi:4-alpha-glucanotransferase